MNEIFWRKHPKIGVLHRLNNEIYDQYFRIYTNEYSKLEMFQCKLFNSIYKK